MGIWGRLLGPLHKFGTGKAIETSNLVYLRIDLGMSQLMDDKIPTKWVMGVRGLKF